MQTENTISGIELPAEENLAKTGLAPLSAPLPPPKVHGFKGCGMFGMVGMFRKWHTIVTPSDDLLRGPRKCGAWRCRELATVHPA